MNQLSIENKTKYQFLFKKDFENILNSFQKKLNYQNDIKVDVLITNNNRIRKISNETRKINKSTDVLSFPFLFENFSINLGFNFLGEIILSYEKILMQAKKFNHSVRREFCYLFAHGLVHLSGRDHKKSQEEEKKFNQIVDEIMNELNIKRK